MSKKVLELQKMEATESKVVTRKSTQSNSCHTKSSISIACH
ncbi:hypothetical protein ABID14_001665 [Peptoniphilus olsenii]|uniref:Uncharacterized protein n=1 Tax=Peptoniphilus olsenii TaxID=411570 RepID=A0ABV2JB63_9FIRM